MSKKDVMDYVFNSMHNTNPTILNQKLDDFSSSSETKDAVKYTKQSLTEEERRQARFNIAQYQYIWKEVWFANFLVYDLADYGARYNSPNALDFDLAINLKSVTYGEDGVNSLGALHYLAKWIADNRDTTKVDIIVQKMTDLINEYNFIAENGGLSGETIYIYMLAKRSYR